MPSYRISLHVFMQQLATYCLTIVIMGMVLLA
jgi:hypothetical protein